MWPGLVQTAKEGGVDAIESYVFWNGHELSLGKYNFEGRYDLVKFVKIVQQAGMYMILRIGPFVAAEWNFGYYGDGAKRYVTWAAKMAVSQNIGVPWIMCQQDDAPDPVYHGGTNFGRTSGGPFITTSYDYEAPIDEYGKVFYFSWYLSVSVFSARQPELKYLMDSLLGLPRLPKWGHLKELHRAIKLSEHALLKSEPTTLSLCPSLESAFCLTERMLRSTQQSIIIGENEEILKKGSRPVLLIESKGHALHAFVNQELQGSASGNGSHSPFKFENPISLKAGKNEIALLSMTVGLQNAGGLYEWVGAGLTSVKIEGFNNGTVDLSMSKWTYKEGSTEQHSRDQKLGIAGNVKQNISRAMIGLQGEHLGIYKPDGLNGVNWVSTSEPPRNQPLTWYKVVVDPPSGDEPVGLDMIHMGKGLAWLNGEEIGKYWPIESSKHDKCVDECDYRGKFFPDKCLTGCGEPSQRWYHVPRSWFKPSGNILVIFEEKGGDPTKITFSKRKTSSLCSNIGEDFPMVDQGKAAAHLKCPKNTLISNVKFASFGNPSGRCGSYSKGDCHDPNSTSAVEKACLGKNECGIELTEDNFGKGLCPGKKLAIQAVCT
ncbi:hypothetical protein V6N11_076166 [Hibiscus sabdariffa]|uniref:beta-galactosidase n=1 Tax=Hibiscus sabdariffa TaxID=183260 RepID=A0ABR2Q5X4_9ROSI